jgi:hypothetical protein
MKTLLLALALLISSTSTYADKLNITGNDFINAEGDDKTFMVGVISGVLAGSALTSEVHGKQKLYCPPAGVTVSQDIEIFIAYLKKNPTQTHVEISNLLLSALVEAFPCVTPKTTSNPETKF